MKNKIYALAILVMGFSVTSFAQQTATATADATATIVTPISITKVTDMNFGNVASGTTSGTVVLDTAGARTKTGGVTLPAINGTVAAASFTVNGEGNYTYAITLPSSDITLTKTTDGTKTMTVGTFTSNPSGTGQLSSGTQTLNVGATLTVGANQATGTYSNTGGVSVTVQYN